MRKKISFFLRLIITSALLYYLFRCIPYEQIILNFKQANKLNIIAAILIFFATMALGMFRWGFILRSQGLKVSFRETAGAYLSGLFFNLFFPSFVAGDIFRSASIGGKHKEMKKVASTVLMDRFNGSAALVFVAFVAYLFGQGLIPDRSVTFVFLGDIQLKSLILIVLAGLCLVVGVAHLIIFSRRVFQLCLFFLKKGSKLRTKISDFHDHLYFFRQNPKVFFKSLLFSLTIQILSPLAFYVAARGFNENMGFFPALILVPIVMAIALIPIAIAGLGLRENVAMIFFSSVVSSADVSASLSFLNGFVLILSGVIGGVFYVTVYHRWIQSRT